MTRLFVALLFAASVAAQQPPCDPHSITVTGNGSATMAPDRVSFTVGVTTTSRSVSEAFASNNAKTRRVVDALKAKGVKETEIQTSNFSIESPYDEQLRRPSTTLFTVFNSVTITREDPKNVSDLIQTAVDAGANNAGGLRFFNSNPTAARDRALERAVRDARAQADKLAAATGRTVGAAKQITTTPMIGYGAANQNVVAEAITVAAEAPAIEAGVNTVSYSVTIIYDLR